MFDISEFNKIMNVPITIVIASFIIIIITTSMTDSNALKALIGGYSGYMLGMLFILILNLIFKKTTYLDMFPVIFTLVITSLLIFYLSTYFDKISSGEISSYYYNFSILSTVFLFTQTIIIFNALKSNENMTSSRLFNDTTFSLLGLFGVINFLLVITLGIIIHFYSTQG